MKFSEKWLRHWVDLKGIATEQLVHRLTMSGLEVDSVEPVAGTFTGVVVGRIVEIEPHPDADKLRVCRVDAGDGEHYQVVCGAPNARQGLLAPMARVGAVLPGDFRIKPVCLRGVESAGMLCSASELKISDDAAGLMELPEDAPVGTDLREYLGLDDVTIEIDLTPNRADCLGLIGLAQDVAATFGRAVHPLQVDPVAPDFQDRREIRLEDPADCPRYVGRAVRGIDASATTPQWMAERLRNCGLRPINPVVDVTNYVLLELGQPMHAFDEDQLSGAIVVRRARAGEQLLLLTGDEVELDERYLLIADEARALGLGGIMGGDESAVSDATRNVFFESAFFQPASIVGRARDLGLHTDASHRFERGVDPEGQRRAIERATALLIEIAGGQAGPVMEAVAEQHLPQRQPVRLRAERIGRLLGASPEAVDVERILVGLGMEVSAASDGSWLVVPPSRRFDIQIEEDLIEEVARVHGYDRLPGRPPEGAIPPVHVPEGRLALNRVRTVLVDRGYSEAINYSFIAESRLAPMGGEALPLANPLSADLGVMRTSLVPGLLATLTWNQHRQQQRVRLFEIGTVFLSADGAVEERQRIAGVCAGPAGPEQWGTPARAVDFFDAKGDIEGVLALVRGGRFRFEAARRDWLHPGQAAEIHRDGQCVGWLGAVHPRWTEAVDAHGPVFAFELDVATLGEVALPAARALSRYPSIRRDLAIIVADDVRWQQIQDMVEEIAGNLLTELVVFDEYRGPGIDQAKKSVALGMILQDQEQTLTDDKVDALVDSVVAGMRERFDAVLRG